MTITQIIMLLLEAAQNAPKIVAGGEAVAEAIAALAAEVKAVLTSSGAVAAAPAGDQAVLAKHVETVKAALAA